MKEAGGVREDDWFPYIGGFYVFDGEEDSKGLCGEDRSIGRDATLELICRRLGKKMAMPT